MPLKLAIRSVDNQGTGAAAVGSGEWGRVSIGRPAVYSNNLDLLQLAHEMLYETALTQSPCKQKTGHYVPSLKYAS